MSTSGFPDHTKRCREEDCLGILLAVKSTLHDDNVRFECTACDYETLEDGDRVRGRINRRLGRQRY